MNPLPDTMKAVLLTGHGGLDKLQYGYYPLPAVGAMVELDLRTLYLKHLQIHGSSQGTRKAFARLLHYIETGKIRANLFATYPLSEFHRAQRDFMSKNYIGKLVVMPDRFSQPVD